MYQYISSCDWDSHDLGPLDQWDRPLLHHINYALGNQQPMLILWGEQLFQFYNDAYFEQFCENHLPFHTIGKAASQLPCCNWEDLTVLAEKVLGGRSCFAEKIPVSKSLTSQAQHYHFSFSPLCGSDGSTKAVMACGHPLGTRLTHGQAKIKDHCEKHMAMAVLSGNDLILDFASDKIRQYWGIADDVNGVALESVLPFIRTTGYYDQLKSIFLTTAPVKADHQVVTYRQNGQTVRKFVDFCFDPCLSDQGQVTGIIVTATDVTYKIIARKKLKLKEYEKWDYIQRLEIALQAGSLGCYELFLSSGLMNCTELCKSNYGLTPDTEFDYNSLINSIVADDREGMLQAVELAIQNKTDYHAAYRVSWPDGTIHWISSSGRALYSADGIAIKMVGVTSDITGLKNQKQHLESLVAQRTRQLTEANRQLEKSNRQVYESLRELKRSNASLEGFAYTASHDLQEPLRKIQSFGTLLKRKLEGQAGQDCLELISRMQSAGERMSILIQTLLELSRHSAKINMQPVQLIDTVHAALDSLEIKIQETSARFELDELYSVQGNAQQITQLFQNLIANSLRFRMEDRPPVIKITCEPILGQELPSGQPKPEQIADFYHKIQVSDNGIGFEAHHATKIFEIFQRLHGRSAYEGTGIGLAICKQVVENHHGMIMASGTAGEGATFTVFLPMAGRQQ